MDEFDISGISAAAYLSGLIHAGFLEIVDGTDKYIQIKGDNHV